MNKTKLSLLVCLLGVFGFLVYQKYSPKVAVTPPSNEADSLKAKIVVLEEEIEYLKIRERNLVETGGVAKQKLAELEFAMSKQQPTRTNPKPNPNEKTLPISVSASEYYNDILSKRYENN